MALHQPILPGSICAAIPIIRTTTPWPSRDGSTIQTGAPAGGCDFPVDPALAAPQAKVWWRPELDARAVLLTVSPNGADALLTAPAPDEAPHGDWTLGQGLQRLRLALQGAPEPGAPLAALVPIDATLPARLEALASLWRRLDGREARAEDPITSQRRTRLKGMLRAWDARLCGAAHRAIAEALYGQARVDDAPWKTSALRDATLRLVRDGARLVRGAYRDLLR
jgi:hypothetical protein